MLRCLFAWALAAFLGCGETRNPHFSAVCHPDEARHDVTCTVTNEGPRHGRACVTSRQTDPTTGKWLDSRRTCTKPLAPAQEEKVIVTFEEDVAAFCATKPVGGWRCRGSVVENSRTLGENLPPSR